jgi:thiosulfate/3-mercaptopyruvate sulfurtransferase
MDEGFFKEKRTVTLVSTEWLHEHIEDKDLAIVDVQPNIHDYLQEHIPGAVFLNEGVLRESIGGVPGRYVPPESIQPILRSAGLKRDKPVLVYTGIGAFSEWGDGLGQTMMAYSLARFGFENIYVLDGGLMKWREECRTIVRDYPKVEESDFVVQIHRDYFIEYEEFKAVKDSDETILIDARPAGTYAGQGPWLKPGHIPGAINLPWRSLMDDINPMLLKSNADIRTILSEHMITPQKTIICYCGTGREATNEFLLFKWYLGFPKVRLYEGSFTEWVAYPDNPVVTGESPRAREAVTV